MQDLALQPRLRIPLLFGLDVIHGYQTTFPIPLAESASWDRAAGLARRRCGRVLRKEFEVGLFDDAQRFADAQRERAILATPAHRQAFGAVAAASIVLMKNEGGLLPLAKSSKTIGFTGPLVKAQRDNQGAWAVEVPGVDYEQLIVTQWDGERHRLDPGRQSHAEMKNATESDLSGVR